MTDWSAPAPDRLPRWPLTIMFGAIPVLWLSGGFYLFWPVLGLVLTVLLLTRRERVTLPTGAGFWLVFCALVALSATRLSTAGDVLVAALRLAFYLTALVVALYVYTALREGQSWDRVFRPLCLF